MTDHYKTLGVERTASQDEIKRAYRKLASQHHPDKGGDKTKFQEVQAAYDVLGDEQKRAEYNNPRPTHQHFNFQDFGGAGVNINDIFGQMFGGGFNGFNQQQRARGHARVTLWITLNDVATGGARTVSLGTSSGSSTVEINIPKGINDGDNVQYAKLAPGGVDLVVTFRIHPDSAWHRKGQDLIQEHKISVWDLILGGTIKVHDILNNELEVQVPPNTQPGVMLRVKSRGLPDQNGHMGDMYIKLHAQIPRQIAPELKEAIQKYRT